MSINFKISGHEIGLSSTVIRSFLTSKEFTSMSVGGGIDEGFTYSSNKLLLLYQDKAILGNLVIKVYLL